MRVTATKKQPTSLVELQEVFEVLYSELCAEFAKIQASARDFRQARPSTETYDQAWADLYVSLGVLEAKARSLQEILDQISELLENEEYKER